MENFQSLYQGENEVLQFLAKCLYTIWEERDTIKLEIHIILAALFPIYVGSHASLQRPPTAAATTKSSKKTTESEDDEDEIEIHAPMEGLSPSDAILFPLMASLALGTLYLIIKWLDDPKILNKILGWYFSTLGVFVVGKFAGDALNLGVGFMFPSVWSDGKHTYNIDPLLRLQAPQPTAKHALAHPSSKTNPLPGWLSNIHFPEFINDILWSTRALVKNHWILRIHVHNIISHKASIRLPDAIGFSIGALVVFFYNVYSQPWFLTNLMGFGFCYSTLQLMSPTTFTTGSLVLLGLFFYDIVMVFYTPLMVTVATNLDVPIKLVFPGPTRSSMLGLGDIALPGIMIALALRFDLYLHYLRLRKSQKDPRPTWQSATGFWGERFWTSSAPISTLISNSKVDSPSSSIADGTRFRKIYFKTAIFGYIVGMIATLVVLNVFKHAQPALLYLVPGVVGSLWGMAVLRGEVGEMWKYTEDGSLDFDFEGERGKKKENKTTSQENGKKEVVAESADAEKKGETKKDEVEDEEEEEESEWSVSDDELATTQNPSTSPITSTSHTSNSNSNSNEKDGNEADDESTGGTAQKPETTAKASKKEEADEHAHNVFLFSISEPRGRVKARARLAGPRKAKIDF